MAWSLCRKASAYSAKKTCNALVCKGRCACPSMQRKAALKNCAISRGHDRWVRLGPESSSPEAWGQFDRTRQLGCRRAGTNSHRSATIGGLENRQAACRLIPCSLRETPRDCERPRDRASVICFRPAMHPVHNQSPDGRNQAVRSSGRAR